MRSAALDIGGANIKASRDDGGAFSRPFALWKSPTRLPAELSAVIRDLLPFDLLAVTMTGEICDCYEDRSRGVRHIVESAVDTTRTLAPHKAVRVWRLDGRLVEAREALEDPLSVAAANWLALATWAAGRIGGDAVLIDIGSTTTDIVSLQAGRPCPVGFTDRDRLQSGELVYSGIARTPVCAVVDEVSIRRRPCRVAAEVFATTLDVYLLLGDLEEGDGSCATADGREASREGAQARIARMVCSDAENFNHDDACTLAREVARAQLASLRRALEQVSSISGVRPQAALISGTGEFLARRLASSAGVPRIVSCAEIAGRAASDAACAFALAHIASDAACT